MATPAAVPHPVDHPSAHLRQSLTTAVEGALWSYAPLRLTNTSLGVTDAGGVVTLSGNVRTRAIKTIAGRLAQGVVGVTGVVNALVADPDIEREVAMALALEPAVALSTDKVAIKCLRGTVYLGGTASAPDLPGALAIVSRAVDITRAVPGVTSVLNHGRATVDTVAVSGSPTAVQDAPGAEAAVADVGRQAVLQERMAVWRERAAAKR